jgi:Protein of unknown function (DUF1488)
MFVFPGEPSWNEAEHAVEFEVEIGEYRGRVFVPVALFQHLLGQKPPPEECVRVFYLERTRFERLAEQRIIARALDPDTNIRLTLRDLVRYGRDPA